MSPKTPQKSAYQIKGIKKDESASLFPTLNGRGQCGALVMRSDHRNEHSHHSFLVSRHLMSNEAPAKFVLGLTGRLMSWFLGISLICVGVVAFFSYTVAKRSLEDHSAKSVAIMAEAGEKNITTYVQSEKEAIDGLRDRILLVVGIVLLAVLGLAMVASRSISEFARKPLRNAVRQLTDAVAILAASTQQSSAAAQQDSSTAQQLAAGATQQSEEAEDISKNIAQMAAAIAQMSASSQEAAQTSSETAEMAQAAGVAGEASQKNLVHIKIMVNETAVMVKDIATSSEQIGEIVDTITSIAEQTNLLALNAAIEAARAGDAGRGFAVVADEVRKLAENSGKSAEEIKHRIKSVLGKVEQTVTAVESSVGTVESSTKAISETLQSLQSISAAIQQVSAKIQEVSMAIQQQSTSVQGIAESMEGIVFVSEQNASGAQQLSVSTQQQSAADQQIAVSTQQLVALGVELQQFVGGMREHVQQLANVGTTTDPVPEREETPIAPVRAKKIVRRTRTNRGE